jgi:Flp pilus assembly protein TadG
MTEAAIVSPLFFALLFGVIEMGILFRDNLTITNATRDGARAAAASGADADADWRILQTIRQSVAAANPNDVVRIVVFAATSTSDRPTTACASGTATDGVCNVYTPADFTRPASDFNCVGTAPDRPFCPGGSTSGGVPYRDTRMPSLGFVGVYVEMTHHYVTGFFGSALTMHETSVVRIEPRTAV